MRIALILLLAALLGGCTLPQPAPPPTPGIPTASPLATIASAVPLPVTASMPGLTPATPTPSKIASAQTITATPARPAPTLTPSFSPTPPEARAMPSPTFPPYPDAPDGVVQAFLEAYPDDDALMLRYLSKGRQSALPPGGPGELLCVQGDLEGYVIQSATVQPTPPQALVVAELQAGGAEALRTFSLVREQGRWVIDGIGD